jgi:2-polyprenyl-6-hydroxyphenyl methylase/3-demethylubiquinone-9 3-methyltransferase
MTTDVSAQHGSEVKSGDRFEFGKNWSRFLTTLTDAKIETAERSLKSNLAVDDLSGKTFIDIGSGSGLFSLAARRLGARVHSFDYDPYSVSCTRELKRRYFDDDANWVVDQASALDPAYLATLGQFDIVYSWGVLHHTGSMWPALENVKPLAKVGGKLFIAIYNDQGAITDRWKRIKKTYNSLPRPLAFAYALRIIGEEEAKRFPLIFREEGLGGYIRHWTDYAQNSARGMNQWHDWIDWIGGYPYECARVEQIVDFYGADGFKLCGLVDRSDGYGCNEFVFDRMAPAGVFVESRLSGGNSLARQAGKRVTGPFVDENGRRLAPVSERPVAYPGGALHLFIDDVDQGPAKLVGDDRIDLGPAIGDARDLARSAIYLVAIEERKLSGPFQNYAGHHWKTTVADLVDRSDSSAAPRVSDVYFFEGAKQAPFPHSFHADIVKYGAGRFSLWGTDINFSLSDNGDPSGRTDLRLLMPSLPLPAARSAPQRRGVRLTPAAGSAGTLRFACPGAVAGERDWIVFCNDRFVGKAETAADGAIDIAATARVSSDDDWRALRGEVLTLTAPFASGGGALWLVDAPEVEAQSDTEQTPRRSDAVVFEDAEPMLYPHSSHADIVGVGAGRFSHWGAQVYFSTLSGDDPNHNGRVYRLVLPIPTET